SLTGEWVYATRLLSAGFGLLGLAMTMALGRRWRDHWLGLCALLWLGTHGFLLYYLREVRMYSLLFALGALASWLYWRWVQRPAFGWLAGYALTVALLAYTHYFGPLLIAAHGLHLLLFAPRRLPRWLAATGLGFLLFLPWLPTVAAQMTANPAGPHQTVAPSDWVTVHHLIWVLSGGAGVWLLALWLLGGAPQWPGRSWSQAGFVLLWALLPPVLMLAANALFVPLYEPRNVIAVLPALGLLVAAGVRRVRWPLLATGLFVALIVVNLAARSSLRPAKPEWAAAFGDLMAERDRSTALLWQIVEPWSVEAYYARNLPLGAAVSYPLPGAPAAPGAVQRRVKALPASAPVWAVLPNNTIASWVAMAELSRVRPVQARHQVEYMLFYRFGPLVFSSNKTIAHAGLNFSFGDRLHYTSDQVAVRRTARVGESLCFRLPLTVLRPLDGAYSYGLHLVDPSGRLMAQVDAGLADPPPGRTQRLSPCLVLPASLPAGSYAVRLAVYRWQDGVRLPVLESGIAWGDAILVAVVEV
nr:hypothetical protein [Caldilineaceae bacterium]